MDNSNNLKDVNYPLLIFIAVQIVFIIMAAASIIPLLSKSDKIPAGDYASQPSVTIENLSQAIPDFPSNNTEELQHLLLSIIQINDSNVNLVDSRAIVREGTVINKYFHGPNLNYISAVIDIPEISQSYQLFYQYSNDPSNIYIDPNDSIIFLCVADETNVIYSDFDCTDIYSQTTRNSIISKYLKYVEFDDFMASTGQNIDDITIFPVDFNRVNEDDFIKQTKEAVRSFGISPDLFSYRVLSADEYNFIRPQN